MLTHLTLTAIRTCVAREDGDNMSQFTWSIGLIILCVAIAFILGPEIGAIWRELVGKSTP